jgi:hypothetical protein
MRFVIAPSESLRASSETSPADGGREQLRLVDHDEHRIPIIALGVEHAAEERGGGAHLLLDLEAFQIEHDRHAVLPHARGDTRQFGLGAGSVDDLMSVAFRKGDEIALGIDDALLHPLGALFEQPAQEMRLAGPGIALHEQAGGQQFLEIQLRRVALRRGAHVDVDLHEMPFLGPSLASPDRRREASPTGYPQAGRVA